MTLASRLAGAMVLLVAIAVTAVGWLGYRSLEQRSVQRVLERIEAHSQLVAAGLESYVSTARADVAVFRSAAELNGLIRARIAGGVDPVDGFSETRWRERMAARIAAELAVRPVYSELRIIGLADGAREIIRVDRLGPHGEVRLAPSSELQQRGDQGYFKQTINLPPDGIYVSPLDLTADDSGVIETPLTPTLRVAMPVFTPGGEPFGIIMVSVDMQPALLRVQSSARKGETVYVVNGRGQYLVHPDPAREFGAPLDRAVNWQSDFPSLAPSVEARQGLARIAADQTGNSTAVAIAPAVLGDREWVAVIESVPNASFTVSAASIETTSILVGLVAVLCAAALAVFIARSLTRPVRDLTMAVEAVGKQNAPAIPVDAGGETGVLARAFARVLADATAKTTALEREVEEHRRTEVARDGHAAREHFFSAAVASSNEESRRAQETLRESEQLARGIIETALDAFVQMDESGSILNWNSQAEKIFGWPREDVVGKNFIDLIIAESERADFKAALDRFLRSGEGEIFGNRREIRALRRDRKEFTAELSITALGRREGILFNGFFRDLTEKIAAEERIRHSEKMEALGQLTGGIAHDFNNILTVITGTIEILAEAVESEPELAAITRLIDNAAARGADLTQHLLAFARKQPLQPRETDLNVLVVDTMKLLRPTLGENIEIDSVFEHEDCVAIVDPNQLATAILNLSLNARDAMPDGGKLIVETGSAFLDEVYASKHEGVRPGRYALIAVSDTGTGIPAGIIDKVFTPFFTSKGPGKGTGLGLSMVYGFVKQSAGHIEICSEEGHGTTVKMYLPSGASPVVASESSAPLAAFGQNETILVVEDDKMVRDYVLTQLRSLGYGTLDAANAAEALTIVDAGNDFDLLFTDVIMSGAMKGRQLASELQKRKPGMKVLYTSGYTESAVVTHGRLDAGVLLLAKPYRKSDMAVMIRKALAADLVD